MDSISDSDSEDAGSIPAGTTLKRSKIDCINLIVNKLYQSNILKNGRYYGRFFN